MSTTDTASPRTGTALIGVLATLTGVAPLATDMYVPGLPELTRSLVTQPSTVQLSLTAFVGGAVLAVASWRAVFGVLAVLGLLQVVGVLVWVPESLPPSRRTPVRPSATLRAMGHLIRRRALTAHVLGLCFGGAAIFTYITGSTFVFQDLYGASATETSVICGVIALGCMAGSVLFGRLVGRIAFDRLLLTGIATGLGAATALVVLLATTGGSRIVVWACLFAVITAFGLFLPRGHRGRAGNGP